MSQYFSRSGNLDKVELILNADDEQGVLYCNSRVELDRQAKGLIASIEPPVSSSQRLQLSQEQVNSTAIRIVISPNGHIGAHRIRCHWSDDPIGGPRTDVLIGGKGD